MVSSRVYPDLERKPGGPDNWVERAGGLPSYIERIAKHLHYEKGKSISHSIAAAVNTVKRWAMGGTVTKYGTTKRITPATQAKAAKAVAEWNAKRKAGSLNLSDDVFALVDLLGAIDLADSEKSHLKDQKCKYCSEPATKSILWAEGMAYIPCCDRHLSQGKDDVTNPLTEKPDPSEIVGVYDLKTKAKIDLADVEATDIMVALYPPKDVASKVAFEGGEAADDLHVTIAYYPDGDFEAVKEAIEALAKDWQAGPLKGNIGGIGAFPAADDEKQPWFVPVDVPGLNTLHEQVLGVTEGAATNHGYTPHMTLVWTQEGEDQPPPVESHDVVFNSVWVVQGNDTRIEYPLGGGSAEFTEHGRLSAGDIDLSRGSVDIKDLAERANRIADPAAKARARARVLELAGYSVDGTTIDLASTIPPRNATGRVSDGRKSFRKQGKWGHGFKPLDRAAKEAKAKGSPIAMNRMERLFGGRTKAATGRAGSRTSAHKTREPERIKITEKSDPNKQSANDVAFIRKNDENEDRKDKGSLPKQQMEASKSTRVPTRATRNWDEIPESLKTVRNGTKYVLAEFQGKQYLTPWQGGVNEVTQSDLKDRKVMSSISSADLAKMSPEEIQAMIDNPKTPEAVRKQLRGEQNKRRKESAND